MPLLATARSDLSVSMALFQTTLAYSWRSDLPGMGQGMTNYIMMQLTLGQGAGAGAVAVRPTWAALGRGRGQTLVTMRATGIQNLGSGAQSAPQVRTRRDKKWGNCAFVPKGGQQLAATVSDVVLRNE
eukprot:973380-Pleurochrysis_carterae.AAC.1